MGKNEDFFVELRPLESIRPYENNPRNNDGAVDACARSLETFGFRQPIVVDADGVIVAGHTRYKAAQKLGLKFVPVHVADLPPEKIAEYRIADNKIGELAKWDLPKLTIELSLLRDSDPSFDFSQIGFSQAEIEKLLDVGAKEGLTDPDDAPEPPETTEIKRGDFFVFGNHRLLCGDATNADDVRLLMDGGCADLYLTDPPYNVDYTGGTGLKIENDSMSEDKFREFLTLAFQNAVDVLHPGASFYIWHADSEGLNFRFAAQSVGLKTRECLI